MDQAFFGPQSPSVVDTTAVLAKLQEEHTSIGHVEGTCWQARFNHLVGYGAGEPEQKVTGRRFHRSRSVLAWVITGSSLNPLGHLEKISQTLLAWSNAVRSNRFRT
jgi:hypothetical protein